MENLKIARNERYRIKVDGFDGGINCSETQWRVGDNQLTDALNMWWKDGMLRTRPGQKLLPETFYYGEERIVSVSGGVNDLPSPQGARRRLARIYERQAGGETVYDAVMSTIDFNGSQGRSVIQTDMTGDECSGLMLVESGGGGWSGTALGGAVAFIGGGSVSNGGRILAEPSAPQLPWVDITEKAYVPLVMKNGMGSPGTSTPLPPGTLYEGFNLLTPKFRAQFTTNGDDGRFYFLPVKLLDNDEVVVSYTAEDGTIFSYIIPAGAEESETDSGGIALHINRTGGYIYCVQTEFGSVRWFPASGISNNLEVIASKTQPFGRDKICSMRICRWFGGDRSGGSGGARLFVSGHPMNPNLVHWSDVNNPLYFPENNYAYVGDPGQSVTAFAKQGEMLIIFKEGEMYYSTYTSGSRTAQYLQEGTIAEAAANSACFPITQLHPFVGCDCPGTIRLCDNHLVWADSSGRVYGLTAAGRFNESNVRVISVGIENLLSLVTDEEMRVASAGDYFGHYALLAGNDMFLFNYTDLNFTEYLESTSRGRMQFLIPWMYWRLDSNIQPVFMMSKGEQMVICSKIFQDGVKGTINVLLYDGDDEIPIWEAGAIKLETVDVEFRLQTKLFDFGRPEKYKDVLVMYLELNGLHNTEATAAYLDERGGGTEAVPVEVPTSHRLIRMSPNAVRVGRFGLRMEGRGSISVGGMIIDGRIYGRGVR